jgi:hypothetical protein
MWTAALSALPARSSPFPPDVRMNERQTDAVVAAIDDAVRRFLSAYGPATPADFARWLGVSPAWAAELFARHGDLEEVDFEGRPAWMTSVRLLPYFDAYVIGCHPRAAGKSALTGGQAGNVAVLLVDGLVAGVWHQRKSGRRTRSPLNRWRG